MHNRHVEQLATFASEGAVENDEGDIVGPDDLPDEGSDEKE